jgi:phosphate:Na+ symporter
MTGNRFKGAALGAGVTVLMQSSSAMTVLLLGLVGAGLLSLRQTLGVLLGADLGTTVTVQLISFQIVDWAPLMIAIGVALILSVRSGAMRHVGRSIFGFGLVFQGIGLLVAGSASWAQSDLFQEFIASIADAPIILLLAGMVFTAVIQSSAATIGIVIALAANGLIDMNAALPVIYGANVGTAGTALMASVGANVDARRVAGAHILFKVIAVIIFVPLTGPFADLLGWMGGSMPRQVANAHTLFNVVLMLVLLPFVAQVAWLLQKLLPAPAAGTQSDGARYLDPVTLSSPPLALGQATREVLRLADIVQSMLRDSRIALATDDERLAREVKRRDDEADRLEREIRSFLTQRQLGLLYAVNDLESIGDILDKNLMELTLKKIRGRHTFSDEGWREIEGFHRRIEHLLERAVSALAAGDAELAAEVIEEHDQIADREHELQLAHIGRLNKGTMETIDTSDIHMDVVSNLSRISSHARMLAQVVRGDPR